MAPPVDSVQLAYKWLNSMVYGRYNELVKGVYKPAYNWGASSCMDIYSQFVKAYIYIYTYL